MPKREPRSQPKWRRDGTITNFRDTEIDLTNGKDWVTVKGTGDRRSEILATRILRFLNANPMERMGR